MIKAKQKQQRPTAFPQGVFSDQLNQPVVGHGE
jgi:hypothetical protein